MQIKTVLGGEVKWVVSGGAPLAPHIEEFLRVAMCAPVVQGYGLTESCAASFIAAPDAFAQAHTIGPPQPVVEFAVESVPEMGYDGAGAPARGELLLRGRCLFTGYYKQPQQTVRLPRFGCACGLPTLSPAGVARCRCRAARSRLAPVHQCFGHH